MSRPSKNPTVIPPASGVNSPAAPTGFVQSWVDFWFKPQDATVLCMMRIFVGLITVYTFVVHGFVLHEFMGEHAWLDMQSRREILDDRPQLVGSLFFSPLSGGEGNTLFQPNQTNDKFAVDYKNAFGVWPPLPAAANKAEAEFAGKFRQDNGYDFRFHGLPFPKDEREKKILADYVQKWHRTFPPPYPENDDEIRRIDDYLARNDNDPRRLYARGLPIFTVWMHVTDPFWMNVVQGGFTLAAVCFLFGLGTRVVTPIVWFANICYIHRDPIMLFGVDTMMNVILLYMVIAPCGAWLSLDSVLRRGWRRARGLPDVRPAPTISAGVALRLLQVHLCIIYFISGISKLQGQTWWGGTAVWSVVANYEFAPMHWGPYKEVLRTIGSNQMVFDAFIAGAGMFTVAFEVSYPYLVWRPKTRWLMLASAIMLHGGIGLFMGLKTFSLMMIAFNMAFLKSSEARWILALFGITDAKILAPAATAATPPPQTPAEEPATGPMSQSESATAVKVK